MGVTVLHAYPVPKDRTAPQIIEFLQKRIVNLGATLTGQFQVDCETYHSNPNLSVSGVGANAGGVRILNVLHNSEQPATVFSVIEPHAGKPRVTFTSDTLFDLLLLKLSNAYHRKLRIESKGSRFEIGDFVVKLGIVSASSSSKGILVEVEYLPCVVVQTREQVTCWNLIHEFMQGFLGSGVPEEIPSYLREKGNNEIYTPVDTIHQYLEQFAIYRRGGPAPLSGTPVSSAASTPTR